MNPALKKFIVNLVVLLLTTLVIPFAVFGEEGLEEPNRKPFYEIRAGLLAHDVPVWSRSRREGGVDLNAEFIFGWPNCSVMSGALRTNLGASVNTRGDTSQIYSGFLWEYIWPSGMFIDLGLGLAAHNGALQTSNDDRKELGSRILFRVPVEVGLLIAKHQGVSILFAHVSNAYLAHPNQGLDTVGLRYSYRF